MANTTAVYARIDTKLKENAEEILSQLGISPASAIQMFYSQVVLNQGLPFHPTLSKRMPTAIGGMTKQQLENEVQKGLDSLKNEKTYTMEEVDRIFEERYGLSR